MGRSLYDRTHFLMFKLNTLWVGNLGHLMSVQIKHSKEGYFMSVHVKQTGVGWVHFISGSVALTRVGSKVWFSHDVGGYGSAEWDGMVRFGFCRTVQQFGRSLLKIYSRKFHIMSLY